MGSIIRQILFLQKICVWEMRFINIILNLLHWPVASTPGNYFIQEISVYVYVFVCMFVSLCSTVFQSLYTYNIWVLWMELALVTSMS